ncbi:MAG TPA: ABC transporter substrate-binding protein [Planctomycetota bacterium]|nr:ABC transporter substrate-binding protein [Planctomycetota bacterium]
MPFPRIVACLGLAAHLAVAQGVTQDRILVGQSAVLSGPASFLGVSMKSGVEAAFDEVNAAGGVHGRRLKLTSYDDRYEPAPCAENTKSLLERDRVFALLGYVGTPTCNAAKPVFEPAGAPFVGPFTGAATLRTGVKTIFNLRASYEQETAAMAEGLVKGLGVRDVGVFYQNDAYGGTIRAGANKALEALGVRPSCEATYERNTLAVDDGVRKFLAARPRAVVLGGAYAPCAAFVKRCKEAGYDPIFLSVSFVGPEKFVEHLGAAAEGEVVTQVVPSPLESELPAAKSFRAALTKLGRDADVNHVAFEGYLSARLFVEGLRAAGPDLDRPRFAAAMENLADVDLGIGYPVGFRGRGRQASDRVWVTVARGGKLVPMTDWKSLK